MQRNSHIIQDFTYATKNLRHVEEAKVASVAVYDDAKINMQGIWLYGVQPNLYSATLKEFKKPDYQTDSALGLAEQLYTARGS